MDTQNGVKMTRASVPRVRTGCTTCKYASSAQCVIDRLRRLTLPFRMRHLRCGEEKPECRRCLDTGRECGGYALAHSRPGAVACWRRPVASSAPLAAITSYSIPFKIPGSQKDRQKLHYFCVQGASDLSGSLSSSADFWTKTVLPCSHEEPTVRHALIALSSIHLDFVTTECPSGESFDKELTSIETLVQYNKALRQLRSYLCSTDQPSIKVALICCALFYCFESTRGDYDSALAHLRNGLSILRGAKVGVPNEASAAKTTYLVEDLHKLEHMFSRMDLQATLFGDSRMPFLEITTYDERTGKTPIVATDTFKNLDEAQSTLDKLRNQAWRFLIGSIQYKYVRPEKLPAHVVQEKNQLVKQFQCWSSALDGLWCREHCKNPQRSAIEAFREAATMLKLPHRSTQMLILANVPEDKSIFGTTPNELGREIISLVESLRLTDPSRRTYSCEVGIIAPLIMLGSTCRDSKVCGRALMLLAASRRREGLVDAQMIVRIAERIVMLRGRHEELTPMVAEAVEQMSDGSIDSLPPELWVSDAIDLAPGGLHLISKVVKMYGALKLCSR